MPILRDRKRPGYRRAGNPGIREEGFGRARQAIGRKLQAARSFIPPSVRRYQAMIAET